MAVVELCGTLCFTLYFTIQLKFIQRKLVRGYTHCVLEEKKNLLLQVNAYAGGGTCSLTSWCSC